MGSFKRNEPKSLDDLLALNKNKTINNNLSTSSNKTKFLSKSQRDKLQKELDEKRQLELDLKKQNDETKKSILKRNQRLNVISSITKPKDYSKPRIRNGPDINDKKNKFNFKWDADEDTSIGYEPLVEFKTTNPDAQIDKITKKSSYENELHWSQKPLDKMTDRDWRIMREDYDITSKGGKVTNPLRYWSESDISPEILEMLDYLGYREPTPIQRAAIPMGLTGRDIIGIAETGSGKTLAFLIPILNYITKLPPLGNFEGPYVLIMVPTRELALQIEKEFQKFNNLRFNVASLIGGHSYDDNVRKLEKGVEVVIATPGRLVDCIEKEIISLDKCFFLAMDEADRMIDMGFETQVNLVLDNLPSGDTNPYYFGNDKTPKRTTMMFTATMPPAIEKLTSKFLVNPGFVMVGEVGSAVDTVHQDAIQTSEDDEKKLKVLESILANRRFRPPIIIFVNYKASCDLIADTLYEQGFNPVTLHGSKTQEQREAALQQMKTGKSDVLIATDVAGRGIDIPDVSLVINYQMSRNIEDYTHRIGRTGRAGKSGTAITFWNPKDDKDVLYDLKQMISKSPVSRCPEDLRRNEFAQRRAFRPVDL